MYLISEPPIKNLISALCGPDVVVVFLWSVSLLKSKTALSELSSVHPL